jgi:hypothetical protein
MARLLVAKLSERLVLPTIDARRAPNWTIIVHGLAWKKFEIG